MIALSSGEAEVHAATSALRDAMLVRTCLVFLTGRSCAIESNIDASAALVMLRCAGVGRIFTPENTCAIYSILHAGSVSSNEA